MSGKLTLPGHPQSAVMLSISTAARRQIRPFALAEGQQTERRAAA